MFVNRTSGAAPKRATFTKNREPWAVEDRAHRGSERELEQMRWAAKVAMGVGQRLDTTFAIAALEALPIPAALTRGTGEVLGANGRLLELLGLTGGGAPARLRLPLPEAPLSRARDVRTGYVRLARWNGELIEPAVVAVGVGGRGCMLYLITEVAPQPGAPADASDEAQEERQAAERLAALTSRETEVLKLLIAGGSNKAVARELGISPRTVEVHRSRILHKLGARTLIQAFSVAVAAGLEVYSVTRADEAQPERRAVARRPDEAGYSLQFR